MLDDGYYWVKDEYGFYEIAKKLGSHWHFLDPMVFVHVRDFEHEIVKKLHEPKED